MGQAVGTSLNPATGVATDSSKTSVTGYRWGLDGNTNQVVLTNGTGSWVLLGRLDGQRAWILLRMANGFNRLIRKRLVTGSTEGRLDGNTSAGYVTL